MGVVDINCNEGNEVYLSQGVRVDEIESETSEAALRNRGTLGLEVFI